MFSVKTALLAAAAISLGGAAVAAGTETVLATSGAWTATQGVAADGTTACILNAYPMSDRRVSIIAMPDKDQLGVVVQYGDWRAPKDYTTGLAIVFDGTNRFTDGNDNATATNNYVITFVKPTFATDFVHAFTAGTMMEVTVRGAGPISVSLAGTTSVWAPFMDCAKANAPAIVASLVKPPAAAVAAIPRAVPVMPAIAAQPPGVAEVGLLTAGGVKHVRGVAGSGTAILFMLDSGASTVQLPQEAAGKLALDGELVPTGRSEIYTDANGGKTPHRVYVLKSLTVGERTVTNVECIVTETGDALLGQSFLSKLGSWSIDNARQMLVLGAPIA